MRRLLTEFQQDARLDQVFVVLTLGSTLIATLGLLANSAAVVIGAMIIAPWITPLRATAFGILRGRLPQVIQGLVTLLVGAMITVSLSLLLGKLAGLPDFGNEVLSRTAPNLLDLGIALVAGGIAAYAKVRSEAVSSLAGTAIAVALVPPVCVMGLLLSADQWNLALGAGLLYLTNLMGILSGCLVVLAKSGPGLRHHMRRSRLSLISLALTAVLVIPLTSSFLDLVRQSRQQTLQRELQSTIQNLLVRETVTLGQEAQLDGMTIDWSQNPPLIRVVVRASRPDVPSPKQVAAVQKLVNERQGLRFRLVVERSAVEVVGPETEPNPQPENGESPLPPAGTTAPEPPRQPPAAAGAGPAPVAPPPPPE
ncbi:hypothetical protein ICNINCKA_01587 [Synechococcus sp. CBW1107]|nr:DUF389 domain-containing protein [Synechococcus sp. EJ6-Ellesmere]CAK6694265.1 hypothetical protein ICNINCKA_01587 [Synechococcus sp. CBW1107]